MQKRKLIKIKCKKCGHCQGFGENTFWNQESYKCEKCKSEMPDKVFAETKNRFFDDSSGFEITNSYSSEISRLEISLKAQDKANEALINKELSLGIDKISFNEALNNSELFHTYFLALTLGAIEEYHQQLRSALKEQGISIDNLIEIPLYPSND